MSIFSHVDWSWGDLITGGIGVVLGWLTRIFFPRQPPGAPSLDN